MTTSLIFNHKQSYINSLSTRIKLLAAFPSPLVGHTSGLRAFDGVLANQEMTECGYLALWCWINTSVVFAVNSLLVLSPE